MSDMDRKARWEEIYRQRQPTEVSWYQGEARASRELVQRADRVRWVEADVLTAALPSARYALWHDRAVFHFLTSDEDRARYVAQVEHAVRPGGYVIIGTFALDAPPRCSGFDVARYTPESLHAVFGAGFQMLAGERDEHRTPAGMSQPFTYCLCRRETRP